MEGGRRMPDDGEELMNIIKTRAISDLVGEVREERKCQDDQVKETISDLSNRIMNLERGAYLSDKFK